MKNYFLVFALMLFLLLTLAGCNGMTTPTKKDEADATSTNVDLVTYLKNEDESISAHTLSIALDAQTIQLSSEPLFTVPGGLDWLDQIYPATLSDNALVLKSQPLGKTAIPYSITQDETLYYQDFTLHYDETTATVKQADQTIAKLPLSVEGSFVIPQAFFVGDDGQIAILANTNASTYDLVYPVTLLYHKTDKGYDLEKSASFQTMFEDENFSKINQPSYVPTLSNIYGNGITETFLWNETTKIVALDPSQGTMQVLVEDTQVTKDLPEMDTSRDFLEFFSDVAYQNGVYLASFPNYNGIYGTNVAFYSPDKTFLGCVLCTEDGIVLTNGYGEETALIDKDNLCGPLYIPQFPLT